MQMGKPMTLSDEQLEPLLTKRASAGLGPQSRQERIAELRQKEAEKQKAKQVEKKSPPPTPKSPAPPTILPEATVAPPSLSIDPGHLEELVLDEVKKLFQDN